MLKIMKTKYFILWISGMIFFFCSNTKLRDKETSAFFKKGLENGRTVEKTYSGNFSKIEVKTSINVEIVKSSQNKVVISAPEDIIDKIKVDISAGKVEIGSTSGFSTKNVKTTIYARDFNYLASSSTENIVLKDGFSLSRLDVKISSSGNIFGNISATNLSIKVNGIGNFEGEIKATNLNILLSFGDIKISGKAKNAQLENSSSGSINAKDLIVENATIKTSSSGNIYVGVEKYAKATTPSNGQIHIYKRGNLKVDEFVTGSGKVIINKSL